jgi:transcriptional regulator GlxA family with amidase domain
MRDKGRHLRFLTECMRGNVTEDPSPRCKLLVDEVQVVARMFTGKPLRVASIYKVLSVGPGAIRRAFLVVHGCSPRRFFRDQRLQAVRAELHSAIAGVTVTQVATRHGFVELGRFATQYRAAFGESPSSTLRRALTLHASASGAEPAP